MPDEITEYTISVDRGKLKETLKTESGVVINRKGQTEDMLSYIQNKCAFPFNPLDVKYPHPNEILYGKTSDIIKEIMEEVNHFVMPSFLEVPVSIECLVINPLDVKYPHVCFKCKTPIIFEELFNANRRNHEFRKLQFDMPLYRSLKKLWKSKYVEFFCCTCHRKKKDLELIVTKQERLKKKAKRICEKFGYDFSDMDFEFRKLQ